MPALRPVAVVAEPEPATGLVVVAPSGLRVEGLGVQDEGALGPRGHNGFYAGYFRDPDGNKLGVFCIERPESALSDPRKGP